MEKHRLTMILLCVLVPCFLLLLVCCVYCCCCLRRRRRTRTRDLSPEAGEAGLPAAAEGSEAEQLVKFAGAEGLTVADILEAPGEVVGRSSYGTVYRATLQRAAGVAVLLRFVRPACAGRTADVVAAVRALGAVRHANLVPMRALYVGPRGEKLFVHPFYAAGSLAHFLRDGIAESYRWEIMCKVSLGIARGLCHLHTGLSKPIIHGNLKTNNILLDSDLQPRVSDFGLHLLLNPAACQEMLDVSAVQGYKAPELVKMKEVSMQSDVYSLGVILLEMLTQKEPMESTWLQSDVLRLPTTFKDLVLEEKISKVFSSDLITQSKNSANGEGLLKFFQLAMACCSPSASLRPDIKTVLRRLEEIARDRRWRRI